jgi:hypothetical protein
LGSQRARQQTSCAEWKPVARMSPPSRRGCGREINNSSSYILQSIKNIFILRVSYDEARWAFFGRLPKGMKKSAMNKKPGSGCDIMMGLGFREDPVLISIEVLVQLLQFWRVPCVRSIGICFMECNLLGEEIIDSPSVNFQIQIIFRSSRNCTMRRVRRT